MTLFGQEHIERYVATDGAEGYQWREGTTILILTTTGRRSGEPRSSALIFRAHGPDYLVVASKGGADEPPNWYRNLQDDPGVQVQIKGEKFAARARTATADEKPQMWQEMLEAWPAYAEYQEKTSREIPVVVLERSESSSESSSEAEAGGDAKAKFREALERKRSHQADRAADADAQAASKIRGEHGATANSRMFRRKSGG